MIGRLQETKKFPFLFYASFCLILHRYLIPLCPVQLHAPILHQVASYTPIQPLIFGGKWIGSGGDGSLLLLTQDAVLQQKVIRIIHEELKLYCWPLSILK